MVFFSETCSLDVQPARLLETIGIIAKHVTDDQHLNVCALVLAFFLFFALQLCVVVRVSVQP